MTPTNKIKREILLQAAKEPDLNFGLPLDTDEQVDAAYDRLGEEDDASQEYEREFRHGEVETNIPPDQSRHYASKSVAAKMSDDSWVGWTYYFAGGKHGEPENVEWMEDAYDLEYKEEEKVVTVRTFTKVE